MIYYISINTIDSTGKMRFLMNENEIFLDTLFHHFDDGNFVNYMWI